MKIERAATLAAPRALKIRRLRGHTQLRAVRSGDNARLPPENMAANGAQGCIVRWMHGKKRMHASGGKAIIENGGRFSQQGSHNSPEFTLRTILAEINADGLHGLRGREEYVCGMRAVRRPYSGIHDSIQAHFQKKKKHKPCGT
jgi:hypothetical protein